MTEISQSALAREIGITRSAVNDAVKKKTIPHILVNNKKKLDLDNPVIQSYIEGNRQREQVHPEEKSKGKIKRKPANKKRTGKKSKAEPEQQSNLENNRETPEEYEETILDGIPNDLKNMTKHDLDRMKSAMKVLQDQLKHERDRGLYIDKDIVKRTFHAIYRIDTEEFLQLSSTLSAKICQDIFGTNEPELMTKTSEVLDTEFYKVQNHIRVTLNRDLGSMGIEGVG